MGVSQPFGPIPRDNRDWDGVGHCNPSRQDIATHPCMERRRNKKERKERRKKGEKKARKEEEGKKEMNGEETEIKQGKKEVKGEKGKG